MPEYLLEVNPGDVTREHCDYLIIGSGIAGLFAALHAADFGQVILVTKQALSQCNTVRAQGGIAAALAEGDSPFQHLQDTLSAGAGLCDLQAVEVLATEGPDRIRELDRMGVPFDRDGECLAAGLEAAHSRPRVVHAGGDATGRLVWETLAERVRSHPNISVREFTMAVDLLPGGRRCYGSLMVDLSTGRYWAAIAGVTVLATGGAGYLYAHTTNTETATGDGIAMAYRAGADLKDLEFVQFHPTALHHPGNMGFLISEAVRGEGAILLNHHGERFMPGYHPAGELAPRDVVARAMTGEMRAENSKHLFLDVTHLDAGFLRQRFPQINAGLMKCGIDFTFQPIPVAPAAHYTMGGVRTDLWGRTSLEGLYACGETACTGVHGANRLASNSLLEGLVFSHRVVRTAREQLAEGKIAMPCFARFHGERMAYVPAGTKDPAEISRELHRVMQDLVGILRSGPGLVKAYGYLNSLASRARGLAKTRAGIELQNQVTAALLITAMALDRRESCGSHYRTDFPCPAEVLA